MQYNDDAIAGAQWAEEWAEPQLDTIAADAGLYAPGTDNNTVNLLVGDEEAGIWMVGGYAATVTADTTEGRREFRLTRDAALVLGGLGTDDPDVHLFAVLMADPPAVADLPR